MRFWPFIALLLVSACGGSSGGGGNNPPPGDTLPPFGTFSYTTKYAFRPEIEPNDDIGSADPRSLPALGESDYVGFVTTGSVNEVTDLADYFSFTSTREHRFSIHMCGSDCTLVGTRLVLLDTAAAYFELLDQSGALLLSSQGDMIAGNDRDININAGVIYYLAVFAEDTQGTEQAYRIEAAETPPFP